MTMGPIVLVFVCVVIWLVVLAVVVGLCWSSKEGDQVTVEALPTEAEATRRFRSTA